MNHITAELVTSVAQTAYERQRSTLKYGHMPEWCKANPLMKHHVRELALEDLNLFIPILIDAGWLPPAKHDAIRETVRDLSVNELHKSLMDHLKLDPVGSGYTSRESINGYSEGAEHGTISIASRIKAILDGE